MNADETLRCRVPRTVKERFEVLAQQHETTTSALLRSIVVATVLEERLDFGNAEVRGRRDLIAARLRPGDKVALHRRAAARAMKPATYLALVVRAHLHGNAPLPAAELREVIVLLNAVADVGASLRQVARTARPDDSGNGVTVRDLAVATERVEQARTAIARLVRANILSWETSLAEAAGHSGRAAELRRSAADRELRAQRRGAADTASESGAGRPGVAHGPPSS